MSDCASLYSPSLASSAGGTCGSRSACSFRWRGRVFGPGNTCTRAFSRHTSYGLSELLSCSAVRRSSPARFDESNEYRNDARTRFRGEDMDRQVWLTERRAAVVAVYDAQARTYDDNLYPADMQQEWVTRVLRLIPLGSAVLDAPCGTGRYFHLIVGAGMRLTGVDQSSGMLAKARARN